MLNDMLGFTWSALAAVFRWASPSEHQEFVSNRVRLDVKGAGGRKSVRLDFSTDRQSTSRLLFAERNSAGYSLTLFEHSISAKTSSSAITRS